MSDISIVWTTIIKPFDSIKHLFLFRTYLIFILVESAIRGMNLIRKGKFVKNNLPNNKAITRISEKSRRKEKSEPNDYKRLREMTRENGTQQLGFLVH